MRVLKELLAALFPPHDVAEEARIRWANEQAMTRPVSPRELRGLLAAVKDDYRRANGYLRWLDVGCAKFGVDKAWRLIYDDIAENDRVTSMKP